MQLAVKQYCSRNNDKQKIHINYRCNLFWNIFELRLTEYIGAESTAIGKGLQFIYKNRFNAYYNPVKDTKLSPFVDNKSDTQNNFSKVPYYLVLILCFKTISLVLQSLPLTIQRHHIPDSLNLAESNVVEIIILLVSIYSFENGFYIFN